MGGGHPCWDWLSSCYLGETVGHCQWQPEEEGTSAGWLTVSGLWRQDWILLRHSWSKGEAEPLLLVVSSWPLSQADGESDLELLRLGQILEQIIGETLKHIIGQILEQITGQILKQITGQILEQILYRTNYRKISEQMVRQIKVY